jgi:hypothetical protein
MAGLIRRVLLGQLAPLRSGAQHPKHSVENGSRVVPRTASAIGTANRTKYRLNHLPLFVGQFPTSAHRPERSTPEHLQNATFTSLRDL